MMEDFFEQQLNTPKDNIQTLSLGQTGKKIIDEYISKIANKKLSQFKNIIQTGGRKGQSLYAHVMNGIFLLHRLCCLFDVPDIDKKLLLATYTIHDINKLQNPDEKVAFRKLATIENIKAELENLDMQNFWPEYQDYMNDISYLVNHHSVKNQTSLGWLDCKEQKNCKTEFERLDEYVYLINAVDIVDLSNSLDEKNKKQRFLEFVNNFSDIQYELVSHKLTEIRGLLSNVFHNSIIEILQKDLKLEPIFYYPDGVVYLKPKSEILKTDGLLEKIAKNVNKTILHMQKDVGLFFKFKQGLEFDEKVFSLNPTAEDLFNYIDKEIQKKKYKIADKEKAIRLKLSKNLDKSDKKELIQNLLEQMSIYADKEEVFRKGELLSSYSIFLNNFCKNIINQEPWDHIYKLFDIKKREEFELFDKRYTLGYYVAQFITHDYENILSIIINDTHDKISMSETKEGNIEIYNEYLQKNLILSFNKSLEFSFDKYLAEYSANPYKQCCYCGSIENISEWLEGDVPYGIKVQNFSNRLGAITSTGSKRGREPKRNVCAICKMQFFLERNNIAYDKRIENAPNTLYLHIFPYSFFTEDNILSIKRTLEKVRKEYEISNGIYINHQEIFENISNPIYRYDNKIFFKITKDKIKDLYDFPEEIIKQIEHVFKKDKSYNKHDFENLLSEINLSDEQKNILRNITKTSEEGIFIPKYSDVLGNLITLPITFLDDQEFPRFWRALCDAVVFNYYFAVKVMISSTSTPILAGHEFDSIYIDRIPVTAKGFITNNNIDDIKALINKISVVYNLNKILKTEKDIIYDLIVSTGNSPLNIFHQIKILIDKKSSHFKPKSPEWYQIDLNHRASNYILEFLEGGNESFMSAIKQMAQTAWAGGLKGESLAKHSLTKPIELIFKILNKMGEHLTLEDYRAVINQEIFSFLERTKDAVGAKTAENVKKVVDILFDELLAQTYKGNINRLLSDEKIIKSAYLFYIRECIPSSKDKSQVKED